VLRLHGDMAAILAQAESAKRLEAEGAVPSSATSAAFARMLSAEIEKWTRVARDSQIKAD
jgi:tripartite-type tricarboxylate transporter receptor subunit TctC